MPVIDLPTEQPIAGASLLYFPVQAVMFFPRDGKKRAQWFAAAMTAGYSEWRELGVHAEILGGFHGWLADLWEFKLAPRRVFEDGIARSERAFLSGQTLLYLLRAAKHHPTHCKLEHVKVIVANLDPAAKGISESLVEKLWPEFKTVSHLWAALSAYFQAERWTPESDEEVIQFLRLAEAYRLLGISARLLDPERTWRVPDEIEAAAEPEILPFEPDTLDLLRANFLDE